MTKTLLLAILVTALAVMAAPIPIDLTMEASPPGPVVGQTAANPCFYGGSNCQLPAGWLEMDAATGGTSSFDDEITYILANLPYANVFGFGSFLIGVDVNDTNVAQRLVSLEVDFSGGSSVVGSEYVLNPANLSLPNSANGVGFSDFIISASGASIVVPGGATTVTFKLTLSGLNDGPDRFFVVPTDQSDNPIPEPATMVLLGSALVALGVIRRCRKSV